MSLATWLKTGTIQTRSPSVAGLPDPANSKTTEEAIMTQTANDAVEPVITSSRKRKRGEYAVYGDEVRAKIARYAIDNGVARASRRFTVDLGHKVSETTVRSMRDQYVKLKKKLGCDSPTLSKSPRGAPTMLGEHDESLQKYIRQVRLSGGVVNARTVTAAAEGIMMKYARSKLQRYGGPVVIETSLARSVLRRIGFVKRKGTKATKTLPVDFEQIKEEFLEKVTKVKEEHNVPDELFINWDQTGCQLVPGGEWTLEQKGSPQVTIAGLDDKRQITVLLSITKSGKLLPPQVIYAGKTERCLPKNIKFPSGWNVTFTESHWSTEESMLEYVEKVVVPYVNGVRDTLPLSRCDQKAIALFDVYKAHQSPRLLQKLKDNGIIPLFVPGACTDRLQPLDLAFNYDYKETLKKCFHDWYCKQVVQHLDNNDGDVTSAANIDTKTSTIKPLHAEWLISTHLKMESRADLIQSGFRKAGL